MYDESFIDAVSGKIELSDDNEYSIRLLGTSSQTAADIYLFKEDFDYLKELPIAGIDTLVASSSYSNGKEITAIDKKQRELPFLVSFKDVSSNYFTYNSLQLKYGNQEITAPNEVIVSESFARKAFGQEDPIGQVIRQETEANDSSDLVVYKIVNVALTEEKIIVENNRLLFSPVRKVPYSTQYQITSHRTNHDGKPE